MQKFLEKFRFQVEHMGCIGVEREHFLVSSNGIYSPRALEFLGYINDSRWTYELSACQVESRTKPHRDFSDLKLELLENENNGKLRAAQMRLHLINREVGDENMPLDIFPDPRYVGIVESLPIEKLRAACRVAGTHIHIGVKDIEHALAVYNALIPYLDTLNQLGDHSNGERLKLYKIMAQNWLPKPYRNVEEFFEAACINGFAENLRNCWTLIRINVHGTVELRMFGVTDYIDEILSWVSFVQYILEKEGVSNA